MSFSSLKLSLEINKALQKNNFTKPTPIQEKVIPLILAHNDVMAKAKTGSGKSASYVLPLLELWLKNRAEGKAKIKALILTPTRELTLQIAKTFETFGEFIEKKPKVVTVIGGEKI
ncbi:MAG: DEAD/DEAH box helicase, partial [Campylobacterota bacterium]|nr:DEAD/DEAH box helicase [Campylobacterota bacterium]